MRATPIEGRHSIPQACRILGMSRKELLKAIHQGPLVAEECEGRLRIWTSDLRRFERGAR